VPKKRKNRGRHKGDKGKEGHVYCENCGKLVPRSKAVRITMTYSPVPPDLAKELEKQGAIIPKYQVTKTLCINCAIFFGILKVRPEEERKKKEPLGKAPAASQSSSTSGASSSSSGTGK